MKHQKSVKALLLSIFCTLLAVTVFCFAVCGGYTIYTSVQELLRYNRASLDVYLNDLTYTMRELEKFNQDVYSNNLDFRALSLENPTLVGAHQIESEMNLQRLIRSRVGENTGILLFNDRQDELFFSIGEDFLGGVVTPGVSQEMQNIRTHWLSDDPPVTQCWVSYINGDTTLLMNTFKQRGVYICSMVDISAFAQRYTEAAQMDTIDISFLTREEILTNAQAVQQHSVSIEDMLSAVEDPSWHSYSCVLQTRLDNKTGVGICGIISLGGVWNHLRVYVILLTAAFLVICALFALMYHLLNQLLIYPLDQIAAATRQITDGTTSIEKQPESIREFQEIQDALSRLVEQKVSLAKDNMNQIYQKEHALLQYYQLQTRSHFVLNCLKTIYSLTVQGDQEKTMKVIGLFSNHLRYVYHDSLSFVPLRAELEEVQDYFSIIELERCDHILLNQTVAPQLLDFPVPPLIIQTFVENFNKHNAQGTQILRFCIRVDKVNLDDQDYVRIRLTDNGIGYSEEALKGLQNSDGIFERNHVGVQNLCRRMDILYQKQCKKAFLNNPGGGALTIFYLPLDPPADAQETHKGEQS